MKKIKEMVYYQEDACQLICKGEWSLADFSKLQRDLEKIKWQDKKDLTIDGSAISQLDSAGAYLLLNLQQNLNKKNISVKFANFSKEFTKLLSLVEDKLKEQKPLPKIKKQSLIAKLGFKTILQLSELNAYLSFVGRLTYELLRNVFSPKHWRIPSLVSVLHSSGVQGLPIIALLSFLIGVVLTYQMGLQLQNYGASIYIVDLLGLSVLREFGPLITAIMVSGRTGSAFTASIGMMKLNQEIDALDTLGVTPGELLLIPRIIGLFIALPLLTMWSDIFGVFGGMVMSNNMLGISWYDFLQRFPQVIPLRSFLIGIGKAPIFALIISSIGCFEGMQVKNSAESVGRNTTKSVVLAIFFIIVADAVFSVIFSKLKL